MGDREAVFRRGLLPTRRAWDSMVAATHVSPRYLRFARVEPLAGLIRQANFDEESAIPSFGAKIPILARVFFGRTRGPGGRDVLTRQPPGRAHIAAARGSVEF